MKKTIIIISTLFLTLNLYAQVIYDFEKEKALIEEVVEVQDINKSEIYERAKIWMASNMKSSDGHILEDDKDKENLIGTGNLLLKNKLFVQDKIINYKMSIFFKDGKYKILIDNLIYHWVGVNGQVRTPYMLDLNIEYEKVYSKKKLKKNKLHLEIDEAFKKLINSLNNSTIEKAPAKSDDW